MKNEKVVLEQKHWTNKIPVLKKIVQKKYYMQGLVQFDDDQLTICGDRIKWLDEFSIIAISQKHADKLAFNYLKEKYPMYGDYVQLF